MLACYIVQAAGLSQFLSPPFIQLQWVCLSVRKLIPSAPSFSVEFTHNTQQDWCPPTSNAHQPYFCHLHQAHFLPSLASLHFTNALMQHTKQIRSSSAWLPFLRQSKTPPDPCAYCIGRLPLLPDVATLRLPPSLNSRSARAHNFGNTPSSSVFPRFYPTLAQGCFPFSFFGWLSFFLSRFKSLQLNLFRWNTPNSLVL